MIATNFDSPPPKVLLSAIGAVVILHAIMAMGLAMVDTPAPVTSALKVTPPIEIELLPPPVEVQKVQKVIIKDEPEPIKKVEAQPKAQPVAKPKPQNKPKPVETIKPKVAAPPKPAPKPKVNKPAAVKKEIKKELVPPAPTLDTITSTKIAEQQRLQELQAQAAAQRAEAQRLAQIKADQLAQEQAAAAKLAAQRQAAAEARAATEAAAQAARDAAAQAASNTPVNFTATNANWASPPNFSFPNRANRTAHSGDVFRVVLLLRVNKQGGIESVRVKQSSGNPIIDKEARKQVRSGRFMPFTKGGVAVVGNVTLPIAYQVP